MKTEFHIEVLKGGAWRAYSPTPFDTLDDAAHECLTIMPHLRRNFDGVRINRIETDLATGAASGETVYNKNWSNPATIAKPVNLHPKGIHGEQAAAPPWKARPILIAIGLIAVTAAGFALAINASHQRQPVGQPPVEAIPPRKPQPQTAAEPARQSYIYRPAKGGPAHDETYDRQLKALQADDGMGRFFRKNPALATQAQDVASVLDALDYLNCTGRDAPKEKLADTFLKYVGRTSAPAEDKDKAGDLLGEQFRRTRAIFNERDRPLYEIGCSGLFAVADVYVIWFQNRR